MALNNTDDNSKAVIVEAADGVRSRAFQNPRQPLRMRRSIGYYVHHQGDGHLQRALAIARGDPGRFVLLGTNLSRRTGDIAYIDLPDDRMPGSTSFDGVDGGASLPSALHYAPLNHDGVRERMARIAQWIAQVRPALVVVDVSVEVAMLCRLLSTPTALVRLNGKRDDVPHLDAFSAAAVLMAPFAQALDCEALPQWVKDKTAYCPGIVVPGPTPGQEIPKRVLVVAGRGGEHANGNRIAAIARATPDLHWRVIGPCAAADDFPSNAEFIGWVNDPAAEITAADIVVGAAGDGLVNNVISIGRPFICIAEPRPFNEQKATAEALRKLSAAIVLDEWPDPTHWSEVLEAARRLNPENLKALGDPHGAAKALRLIQSLADDQK